MMLSDLCKRIQAIYIKKKSYLKKKYSNANLWSAKLNPPYIRY